MEVYLSLRLCLLILFKYTECLIRFEIYRGNQLTIVFLLRKLYEIINKCDTSLGSGARSVRAGV